METRMINGEMLNLEEMFKKNNKLIWSVVKRFTRRGASMGLDPNDLHSLASIGLIKAFNYFDPENYPVKFSTYAVPMMRGELQRFFRDNVGDIKYSRSTIELAYKILHEGLEEEKDNTVIALHFDVTEEQVRGAMYFIRNQKATSFQEVVFQNDGEDITLEDQLGSDVDHTQVHVDEFLDSLGERDRTMVELTMKQKTQKEIGEEVGISQVQVSRCLKRLYPRIEKFFGYPVGYFQDRPEVNTRLERLEMGKRKNRKREKGDLEKAKQLLKDTDLKIREIHKETKVSEGSLYYWSKKIREPQAEENPVTVSKYVEPEETKKEIVVAPSITVKSTEDAEEFAKKLNSLINDHKPQVIEEEAKIEFGVPEDTSNPEQEAEDARLAAQYQEEVQKAEEAAKKAEEHRMNLIKNSEVEFGYSFVSKDISPSDLHTIFTQVGHATSMSGIDKVNVTVLVSTGKLN